jgi:hypothetical protein
MKLVTLCARGEGEGGKRDEEEKRSYGGGFRGG